VSILTVQDARLGVPNFKFQNHPQKKFENFQNDFEKFLSDVKQYPGYDTI